MNVDVNLAAGKKTALAVVNGRGGVLLPAGFELTEKIIAALVKQGIETVEVFDASENEALDVINKKRIDYIESLFDIHKTPNMNELKECLISQIENS
jgi:4-diphosphocytidyl-2C-methyl-D-erythritol kinase